MKIRCDYCGSMTDDSEQNCPNCGAPLSGSGRSADGAPKTIAELKEWYRRRGLPPEEVTRFFIGKDVREPRAFGIYCDENGDYIVYKNKSDGSRAIRYHGSDEEYAVNELYQRLRSEIADQKSSQRNKSNYRSNYKSASNSHRRNDYSSGKSVNSQLVFGIILIAVIILFAALDDSPGSGYYNYNGTDYYYHDSSWFYYNDLLDDWYMADDEIVPDEITDDNQEQYRSHDFSGHTKFEDSQWFSDDYDYDFDSDWDSDSDWDWDDSWDSYDSDWDSDW